MNIIYSETAIDSYRPPCLSTSTPVQCSRIGQ